MIQVNSKNVLIRAKEELIDAGLIICERGVNRQPNKYQFILFGEPNVRGSQKQPKNEPQTGSETGSETGPLYKLNNTKPKVKKEKAAYGQFGKVLLTEAEVAMLQSDFPDTWADWIKRLDIGKESKGYVYANDYAAIHSWKEKDEEEQRDLAFQEMMAEAELFSG